MINYIYLICPFVTIILCQIIKFCGEYLITGKFNISRLFNGNGGMPSTHTSFISSVTMLIGFKLGFDQPFFAFCLIVSLIIAYDGMGVRLESGKQANAINIIVENLSKTNFKIKHLKEQLGHEPLEVFMGYVFGTLMALIFSFIIF